MKAAKRGSRCALKWNWAITALVGLASVMAVSHLWATVSLFPPSVPQGRLILERVGYGEFRYARLFDVYAAALYLPTAAAAARPLHPQTPKRLDLYYRRDVPRARIVASAETVLQRQYDTQRYSVLRPELERWHRNLGDAARGDRFSLTFDGRVLTLRHNGKEIARSSNQALAEAYFGIWLGEPAISEALRAQLLNSDIRQGS